MSSVTPDKTPIETGKETWIEIDKDGKGLGLSIVGGSDTVLGTVVIHEVYSDGAAAVDGRLKPGDQVLEVNNASLRGISHEQAISLLRRTPAKVRLLVYRDVNLQMSLLDPTQIYNTVTVELTKKSGRGLGISIVGRKNEPGVYVSEIVRGGVAEADGRLMQGDQILAINGQDVTASMQEDVATMLKTLSGRITLRIGRWKLTETANRVHAAQPPPSSTASHHLSSQSSTSTQPPSVNNNNVAASSPALTTNGPQPTAATISSSHNDIRGSAAAAATTRVSNGGDYHYNNSGAAAPTSASSNNRVSTTPQISSSSGTAAAVASTTTTPAYHHVVPPPPPAPYMPKMAPPPPLQITVHDENQAVVLMPLIEAL